ncbi:AMP-binding enzyme, partial [Pseudomonas viridiflava]
VKISGQRLELGQIEAALMQHPSVTNAVVILQDEPQRLTACLHLDGTPPDLQALDRQVALHLPAHVRISEYRQLDVWPRTPSGKIDRKALIGLGVVLE